MMRFPRGASPRGSQRTQNYGYIIDPDDDDDILIWATSISICRVNRIKNWLLDGGYDYDFIDATINSINEAYRIYNVESFLNNLDWIISRRSDDGLWTFIVEFFSDSLSIEGLREVYTDCSFGDQLVLKSDTATSCLLFQECEFYESTGYDGLYKDITRENSSRFSRILSQHNTDNADDDELFCCNIVWNYDERQRIENDNLY